MCSSCPQPVSSDFQSSLCGAYSPDLLPDVAIYARNLGKAYKVYNKPLDKLKEFFLKKTFAKEYWALQGVTFQVRKGQALGIIGHNGAGKSTLLQLLAGSLTPTCGEAWIRGRVASLLELGSGFVPDFTGRENVLTNGTALGFSTREITALTEEIQDFAEIGEFFDQPVKNYSSGMFVRLAFAVQACVQPDVLIVDEALAVGDVFFQQKCHARMEQLLKNGTSILLVTHDSQAIRKYCSEVLLLDEGLPLFKGDVEYGLTLYFNRKSSAVRSSGVSNLKNSLPKAIQNSEAYQNEVCFQFLPESCLDISHSLILADEHKIDLIHVALTDTNNKPCNTFELGEKIRIHTKLQALCDLECVVLGVTLRTVDNLILYCQNSLQSGVSTPTRLFCNESLYFSWDITMNTACASYTISLGIAEYPYNISELLNELNPEDFISLSRPLLKIQNIGKIDIIYPRKGLHLPFIGMVGLPTCVQFYKG